MSATESKAKRQKYTTSKKSSTNSTSFEQDDHEALSTQSYNRVFKCDELPKKTRKKIENMDKELDSKIRQIRTLMEENKIPKKIFEQLDLMKSPLKEVTNSKDVKEADLAEVISTIAADLEVMQCEKIRLQKELHQLHQSNDKQSSKIRKRYDDVSQGTYTFPVPCVNEVDDEEFPHHVLWLKSNILGPGIEGSANDFVLPGCNCYPVCLDPTKCICCQESNSKFPYTEDREVSVSVGMPIYECNSSCSCKKQCRNRLVQRGPTFPVEIYKTVGKGWAARSMVDIPAHRFVCEYIGEIIHTDDAEERGRYYDKVKCSYLYDLDFEDKDNSVLCIDAYDYGNISRFLNHSCDPNLQNYQVWIDELDKRRPHVAFFSRRFIKAGEELTFDYKYEKVDGNKASIPCHCGATNCRRWLT